MKEKLASYKGHPGAIILYLLIHLGALISIATVFFIILYILVKGIPNFSTKLFAWNYNADNVSMLPAIINTLVITLLTLVMAVPVGVGSAIYLTQYARKDSKFVKILRVTNETLSGIPSIVYGLFGFLAFVIALHMDYSILAGCLTLAIMVLPLIIRTTEEALLAVPEFYAEGSFGLGAGKLRTIFKLQLPSAMPGILSGIILATGRIVGETAALIFTSGTGTTATLNVMKPARTLAVHMYCLMSEGLYTGQAYATAVVLLIMVIGINALSRRLAGKLTAK